MYRYIPFLVLLAGCNMTYEMKHSGRVVVDHEVNINLNQLNDYFDSLCKRLYDFKTDAESKKCSDDLLLEFLDSLDLNKKE